MDDFIFKSDDLLFATFDILYKSAKALHIDEINMKVSELLNMSPAQLSIMHTTTRSKFQYRMAWARTELRTAGLIENIAHGMWLCSYMGMKIKSYNQESIKKMTREARTSFSRNILLKKMRIKNHGKNILDVVFFVDQDSESSNTNIFSILLSDNGSGKSFTLAQVCTLFSAYNNYLRKKNAKGGLKYTEYYCEYLIGNDHVEISYNNGTWSMSVNGKVESMKNVLYLPKAILALTHTLADKFPFEKPRDENIYHYLGPKDSINTINLHLIENRIIKSLADIYNHGNVSVIGTVMHHIGYDSDVTIKISKDILVSLEKRYKQLYDINRQINQLRNISKNEHEYRLKIHSDYSNIDKNTFSQVANELLQIFNNIKSEADAKIILKKQNENIDYSWLSSGEKTTIESMLSLGALMRGEAIVLIDEPENSLHPKWQSEFIPLLNKAFLNRNVQMHTIIATHSPSVVLQIPDGQSTIVNIDNDKGVRSYFSHAKSTDCLTLEEVLYSEFDFTNNRSIPLQNDMIKIINYIQEQKEVDKVYLETLQKITKISYNLPHDNSLSVLLREAEKYCGN